MGTTERDDRAAWEEVLRRSGATPGVTGEYIDAFEHLGLRPTDLQEIAAVWKEEGPKTPFPQFLHGRAREVAEEFEAVRAKLRDISRMHEGPSGQHRHTMESPHLLS